MSLDGNNSSCHKALKIAGKVNMENLDQVGVESVNEVGLASVPEELKALPRWVVWKIEKTRDGKETKVPYNARSVGRAKSTNPGTWSDYATAVAASKGYAGVGFVIGPPYVGIDLDKCRDPESGQAEPWAEAIIKDLNSYTELSPSGKGFHVWVRGNYFWREGRREPEPVALRYTVAAATSP